MSDGSKVGLYRKKPVEVEAICLSGHDEALEALSWMAGNSGDARPVGEGDEPHIIAIDTLEGTMYADPGDWIIRGAKGEFYPCKPDIFDATYEPVYP
jgi:hypothetical protein